MQLRTQPSATADAVPDDDVVRPFLNFLHASTLVGKPSRSQIAIAAVIADTHMRTGTAQFTYAELARRAACTRRNAVRCVARLRESGFIRVESESDGGGNVYAPLLKRGAEHDAAWQSWTSDWERGVHRDFPQI